MADEDPKPQTEDPPADPPTEDPPAGDEPQPDIEAAQRWDEAIPELAGQYDSISPEAREKVLSQVAAQARQKTDQGGQSADPAGKTDPPAAPPPLPEPPTLDMEGLQADLKRAFEDGDAAAVAQIMSKQNEYLSKVGALFGDTAVSTRDRLGALEGEVRLPAEVRKALAQIPGATEADLYPALEIMRVGDAAKPGAALELAVFRRLNLTPKPKTQRRPSAEDKARGLAAAAAGDPGPGAGAQQQRIPESDAEFAEFMKREEAAREQK